LHNLEQHGVLQKVLIAAMHDWTIACFYVAPTSAECFALLHCRNKGVVCDMKWTSNGEKICIVYDDGAVIVGSVDGNRLWGKELNMQLSLLHWSPDCRFILFCNTAGECHTYDSNGNAVAKVALYCNEGYAGEKNSLSQPKLHNCVHINKNCAAAISAVPCAAAAAVWPSALFCG
jgi:hypothetical protein